MTAEGCSPAGAGYGDGAPKAAGFAPAVAALETLRPSPIGVHPSPIAPLLTAAARVATAFGWVSVAHLLGLSAT